MKLIFIRKLETIWNKIRLKTSCQFNLIYLKNKIINRPKLDQNNMVKKECYLMIQDNTSNLRICFCNFDLSCRIFQKDTFIENVYVVLSCLIK